MFNNVYAGKRVFVTGHTGFKGSWLTAWLLDLGAEITGYSLDVLPNPNNFAILGLSDKMTDLRGDVRDLQALNDAIKEARPDIVFHLAAQALVRESYHDPVGTFETNILGVVNVLESIRNVDSVRACVIVTSDKCYRNDEWVYGYRETDRLGGADPYSASKGCAELVAHSYFDSFLRDGPACATARAGNVIGGGDWAKDRIVPDCARAWEDNKPVILRSPRATRPWQHVLEPISGYLWLGACLQDAIPAIKAPRGQSFNFGPPADAIHSVEEVVKSLALRWRGFKYSIDQKADENMKECGLLKLCCDKALSDLSWKAAWNFDETTRATAEWFARYHANPNDKSGLWKYTEGQIAMFANAANVRGILWAGG